MPTSSVSVTTASATQATGYMQADGFSSPVTAGVPLASTGLHSNGPANHPFGLNLTGLLNATATTIAAAGATQGGATAITSTVVYVTATASTEGVSLPSGGGVVYVFAPGTIGCKVYPPKSGNAKINTHATNAGTVLAAAHGAVFAQVSATLWVATSSPNF